MDNIVIIDYHSVEYGWLFGAILHADGIFGDIKYTMNLFQHFTTALQAPTLRLFSVLGLIGFCATAQAEATAVDPCADMFGLQSSAVPMQSGADDRYGQWWFAPESSFSSSDGASSKLPASLSLKPADAGRFLGAKNDDIIIRWNSAVMDAERWAQREPYLIVRQGAVIQGMDGKKIGHFVRLIAKARWSPDLLVDQPERQNTQNRELVAPLRIEQAVEEVDRTDRVIPRMCVQAEKAVSVDPPEAATHSRQAQILGFMDAPNARVLGTKSSIAIMDQGALHGVTPRQNWSLIEPVDSTGRDSKGRINIARQRGSLQIIQVLDRYSIVRIAETDREVARGAYVKLVHEHE